MENTVLNEFAPQESIRQVREYFNVIENSVGVGDTNRKYTPSKMSSSPGNALSDNTYLTFNISPVGENICDLYNSFIGAKMKLTLRASQAVGAFPLSKLPGCNAPAVWIGFKDSFDSVAAYQILANGRQIYTQDNAHNESFITSCGATEAVKKVDIFSKARHKDVWKRADTIKSGVIIDFDNVNTSTDLTIEIPIKIDLRRFLVLDSIRYLPAFAGNIQLKVKFSAEALQVAPLSLEDVLQVPSNLAKVVSYPKITNKFVPYEEQFTMIGGITVDGSSASDVTKITVPTVNQQLIRRGVQINDAYSYLNCFSLDPNVYTELVEHYSEVALSFPIKRFDWLSMDGSLQAVGNRSTFTATFTPLFVNAIFILWKKKSNYYCNFDNPLFKSVQLNMGAYGNIPADPEDGNKQVMYETAANAMNTNNDLCGFNNDVMRSLTAEKIEDTGYVSNDTTHYFMGFPTECDFTFQQGQTSNSPINYKLVVEATATSTAFTEKPEIGFLRHCAFSIQLKPAGPPVVVIDDYDLSAPGA